MKWMGSRLYLIERIFRNRTGEKFCKHLGVFGVRAFCAELPKHPSLLYMIVVESGPIKEISIEMEGKYDSSDNIYWGEYRAKYIIPDRRVTWRLNFQIQTIRVKTFPVIGSVVDLLWTGSDGDTGVINRIQGDMLLKQRIMKNRDIIIQSSRVLKKG